MQADGQFGAVKTAGHRNCRQAGDVDRNGAKVGLVGLHGIFFSLPFGKGRIGHGGRNEDIAALKRAVEGVDDETAQVLGFFVVGIVVAGAEHVGAKQNAALDLFAEALAAGFADHFVDVVVVWRFVAVADAVVAAEVGGGLCAGQNVIDRQRVLQLGNGELDQLCAQLAEGLQGVLHRGADIAGDALEVLFDDTDFFAAQVLCELGNGCFAFALGGGIEWVVLCGGIEHDGGIFYAGGDGADLVEAGGVGDETVARDGTVSGF